MSCVSGRNLQLAYLLFGLGGAALAVYMVVTSAMNTVFMTAVYQYAAFNRTPANFDSIALAKAFVAKQAK